MTDKLSIDYVRGIDDVTVWLWPNDPDPVTLQLAYREWAHLERRARELEGGDLEALLGKLLSEEVMGAYLDNPDRGT